MIGHDITFLKRIEYGKDIVIKFFDMPLDNRHNFFYKIEYENNKIWYSRKFYRNIHEMYLESNLKIQDFQKLLKTIHEN